METACLLAAELPRPPRGRAGAGSPERAEQTAANLERAHRRIKVVGAAGVRLTGVRRKARVPPL
jgi:hypothetical protein